MLGILALMSMQCIMLYHMSLYGIPFQKHWVSFARHVRRKFGTLDDFDPDKVEGKLEVELKKGKS